MRRILLSGLAVFLGLLATVLTTRAEPPAPAGGGQGSGPVFSDEDKDLQRAAARSLLVSLRQELADGKKVITVPPGDYRFDRGAGVLIQKAEDVEIEATGATFWFGPDRGVVLEKCRRVKLRGLTIDSDPLPWTQGVID